MLKKLTKSHQKQILDFCYKHEHENLFVVDSFTLYKNPFTENTYYGYFQDNKLIGLGVHFKRYNNFVINSKSKKAIQKIVDASIKDKIKLESVTAFKEYGDTQFKQLKKHNIIPKIIRKQSVYTLKKQDFKDFSEGEEQIATKKDIDEIIIFTTAKKKNQITTQDRKRIIPEREFLLRKNGRIISKANIHGVSKNYFQIGGVGTLKQYRRKGYAKRVVSGLCKHYFNKGLRYALLFTDDSNTPAQKVYKNIGFKPVDNFLIAEF